MATAWHKVPICLSLLDYGGGAAAWPCFIPSGNIRADMDVVRDFYRMRAVSPTASRHPKLEEDGQDGRRRLDARVPRRGPAGARRER